MILKTVISVYNNYYLFGNQLIKEYKSIANGLIKTIKAILQYLI